MDKKAKILQVLRSNQEYISGQELCEALGVSRTAVWKIINLLKEEGYEFEAVPNRGYRLLSSPDHMTEYEIQSRLSSHWMGNRIVCLDKTGSTNTEAKKLAEDGAEHGTVVIAQQQTAGRGRRGRLWESPPGTAIYATAVWKPDFLPDKASMLTLAASVGIAKAIEAETGLNCGIKWPNDLMVNGKKICGILTEMSAEPDYIHYVVIGFGINANQDRFPEELEGKATSLKREYGRQVCRTSLLVKILENLEQIYTVFSKTEDLSGLLEDYNSRLLNKDCDVRILEAGREWEAHAEEVNSLGELLVTRPDGSRQAVYAGEVSVRGRNGYL